MTINTPARPEAQPPSIRPRPWRIQRRPVDPSRRETQRQRRIKIERAVALIARTGCDTTSACRAVGLQDRAAVREVRAVCDQRGIVRRHWWGTAYPETLQPPWAYVNHRGPM